MDRRAGRRLGMHYDGVDAGGQWVAESASARMGPAASSAMHRPIVDQIASGSVLGLFSS